MTPKSLEHLLTSTCGRLPVDDLVSHNYSTNNLYSPSDFGCEVSPPEKESINVPIYIDKYPLPWWTEWTCESVSSSQGSLLQCDLSCDTPCTPHGLTSGSASRTPKNSLNWITPKKSSQDNLRRLCYSMLPNKGIWAFVTVDFRIPLRLVPFAA